MADGHKMGVTYSIEDTFGVIFVHDISSFAFSTMSNAIGKNALGQVTNASHVTT